MGFGLLARVNSGGKILMTREEQDPGEWKTTSLQTALEGKMIVLKTINLSKNTMHRNFHPMPN